MLWLGHRDGREPRNRWSFVSWVGGLAASVPFWRSSFCTGPFPAAHPGVGDGSTFVFVAAETGAVLHLLTHRLEPLWVRGPSGGSSDLAANELATAAP